MNIGSTKHSQSPTKYFTINKYRVLHSIQIFSVWSDSLVTVPDLTGPPYESLSSQPGWPSDRFWEPTVFLIRGWHRLVCLH